jgi:hypothetical protein
VAGLAEGDAHVGRGNGELVVRDGARALGEPREEGVDVSSGVLQAQAEDDARDGERRGGAEDGAGPPAAPQLGEAPDVIVVAVREDDGVGVERVVGERPGARVTALREPAVDEELRVRGLDASHRAGDGVDGAEEAHFAVGERMRRGLGADLHGERRCGVAVGSRNRGVFRPMRGSDDAGRRRA